jgi:decaprenyl-phosphate phosphoribosyltransferase
MYDRNLILSGLKLIRPKEWVKNLFIFVPIFFAGKIHSSDIHKSLLVSFVAFCLASSSIYVLNDIVDVEKDRNHPQKKTRPLASGEISIIESKILLAVIISSIGALFFFLENEKYLILSYILLNIAYCFFLKNIPIVDLATISAGFLLRVFTGGAAGDVPISKWLIMMTFLLTMCLGLGKRRDELLLSNEGALDIRKSLTGYNVEFINLSFVFMAVTTVICYIMYSMSPDVEERIGSQNLYCTSFFVVIGVLRFLQIVIVENSGGSPTNILLHDKFIQIILAMWLLNFIYIIYL